MRALHICGSYGVPPRRGTQAVPPGTLCNRSGCDRAAKGYLLFPWGSSALCGRHLLEDRTPPMPTGFGFGSAHGHVGRRIRDEWKDGARGEVLVAPRKRRP